MRRLAAEFAMTDAASPRPLREPRPGPWRRLGVGALVVLAILLALAAVAWLNRRAAARELLIGWLDRKGIEADLQVERVELDRLVARIRVGDPRDPQVTVDRVEVDFALWSHGSLGVTPSRVRLVRPVVRARLHQGRLSFGTLDPLIEEFTRKPPRPDTRGPLILVEQARLRLASDWGQAVVNADARIDDGKLMRLRAIVPPTALASGGVTSRNLTGTADLTTVGDRITGRVGLAADAATIGRWSGEKARGEVVVDMPYPDFKTRKGDGRARVAATITGDRLALPGAEARKAVATAVFDGETRGWIDAFTLTGHTEATLRAAALDLGQAKIGGLDLRLAAERATVTRAQALTWRADAVGAASAVKVTHGAMGLSGRAVRVTARRLVLGGRDAAFEAGGPLAASADRLAWNDLALTDARTTTTLDLVSDGALRVEAAGSLSASRGAWPQFGPAARDDLPELIEMKRALSAFAVDAPAWRLVAGGGGARVELARPATLRPANGGVLTIAPAQTPIFIARGGERGGGALSLTATRGRGLPEARFAVPSWSLTSGGFTARLDGRAALDFGLARGVALETEGRLTSEGGRLTYTAAGCAPVTVERLELDENDVTDLSLTLCPVDQPLVAVSEGRWRAEGAARSLDASAPFLAAHVRDAEGRFIATGDAGGLGLEAVVARATVEDATTPLRFNPLTAEGHVHLKDETWDGAFDLSRSGARLAGLTLSHDGRAGAGGLTVEAPSIVFGEGGLQPGDLSPMAGAFIGSPASGSVAFAGRIDWREDEEGTSSGRLTIPGLDFVSPAGPVKGLRGTVDFTSLAPLITAPNQTLTADTVETFAPLTGVTATFGLDKAGVTVSGGELNAAGGVVRIEPFVMPLDRTQPFSGVITLDRIQLGQLVAGAGFGDKVQLDAVVSGRLPFTSDPRAGWRIAGGSLAAIQPGRLSIQREALSGLQAGGGGEAVPPGTVENLAYQAMEDLAFDLLSAEVNSLDEGRIGVLFHIKGRHDPPERQELRVGLAELISRRFLDRPLPLPSDTGIDLTLDTTLNLNQLIADLIAMNAARNGEGSSEP
jgi:hypothetical protein